MLKLSEALGAYVRTKAGVTVFTMQDMDLKTGSEEGDLVSIESAR